MSSKTNTPKILLSGGSGLLGKALQKIDASIIAPPHSELDVRNKESIDACIEKYKPDIFLHAAAFTSPPRCDESPVEALQTNIIGTGNVVLSTTEKKVRLVYISTDYVFKGDKGNYAEDDEVFPQNLYAWTKLGGECAVRTHKNSLIIRTSFSPDIFPYDAAFIDQYTSRDSVSVIARLIYTLIQADVVEPVVHVGTERKTVKELALALGKSDVTDLRRSEVSFATPEDTSLDISILQQYLK